MDFITSTVEQTERLGLALAWRLRPGDVVAFFGDLGAGKTAFIRGMAKGLGVQEMVTSPTYTVVNEYLSGKIPLFHFDLYRLNGPEDLFDIGWDDYLFRGGICAVEWSERVSEILYGVIRVTIRRDKYYENCRVIHIDTGGPHADYGI